MTPKEAKAFTASIVDEWIGKIRVEFDGKPLGLNLHLSVKALDNAAPDLIALARKGDPHAEGALCIKGSNRIRAGEKLEEPLASYIADLLMQRVFTYKRTKADKNVGRDLLIMKVLMELEKQGIPPTTNRSLKNPKKAGCHYVADEFRRRGLEKHITPRIVEGVHNRRHKWLASID